jgi:hypothetical protein
MLLRPPLIAAAVAMVPTGWAATSYAQAPIAGATTLLSTLCRLPQSSPSMMNVGTAGSGVRLLTAARPPRQRRRPHRRVRPFNVSTGTTPTPRPPAVRAPDTAVLRPWSVSRRQ